MGRCPSVPVLVFMHFSSIFRTSVLPLVLPLDRWINRPALYRPTSGQLKVTRQSRQACSPQRETPFELFCKYLHPSPDNMIQSSLWLVSLSSGSLWQGVREHLARRPTSMGSAGGHRRSPLTVALRQSFALSFTRLHEPHPQRFVRTRHP